MTLVRILIADDEPDIRAALAAVVESEPGWRVVGLAANADEAIVLASRHRPDVALLDFRMPGGGGQRAAAEIARVSPETRVLAVSAHADRGAVFEMLRAGVSGYLVKGATMHEIRSAITRALRGEAVLSSEVTADVVHELADELERRSADDDLRRSRIERISRALEPGAFTIAFQPIVELAGRTTVGFEAISRFPGEPMRPPDAWFAEARDVGLGDRLEAAAIRAAVPALEQLSPECFLSVNVDPDSLGHAEVLAAVEEADLSRLMIELTEHSSISDYSSLERALSGLKARGLRVAVDDAGAGFASLRHVLQIRPEVLKIDASVIAGIEDDPASRALAAALAAFAEELGIVVIAEGIESEGAIDMLATLGIYWGQGYALGRPAPLPAGFTSAVDEDGNE